MWTAFPSPDYYGPSAPLRSHQPTAGLPVFVLAARRGGQPRSGSHVHHVPVGRVGAQLCRCGLATATPQTFAVASDASINSRRRSRLLVNGVDAHHCPARIHQVGAGSMLERVQPLVHSRYASLPCLPDPDRLAVPARPVVVEVAPAPACVSRLRLYTLIGSLWRRTPSLVAGRRAPRAAPAPLGAGARAPRARPWSARPGAPRRPRPG